MLSFIIGFIAGLLSLPMLYYLSPLAIVELSQRTLLRINTRVKDIKITDGQSSAIIKSLHKCLDVHWFNVLVQRFYHELSKSYTAEHRVKMYIHKKFEALLRSGYIRRISVTEVSLGREAPYVKSIQLLTNSEYRKITASRDIVDSRAMDTDETLLRLEKEIQESLSLDHSIFSKSTGGLTEMDERAEGCDGAGRGSCCERTAGSPDPLWMAESSMAAMDRDALVREAYERCQYLVGVEYNGSIRIVMEIELPKKIVVNTTVSINGFNAEAIFRLPAESYATRLEFCFLSDPRFAIVAESGISNANGKLLFRRSISNLIERYIRHLLIRAAVYPSWLMQYLPVVLPSFKNVTHRIKKITKENHAEQLRSITENILLFVSMDYRILSVENNVVHRRINYFINEDGRIFCTHFLIPEISLKTSHFGTRNFIFKDLTLQENKIMNQLYDWSVFHRVISSFRELKTKVKLSGSSSLVRLVFDESSYEFLRIKTENAVIFQRNDEDNPDFIVFKIADRMLYIYQYVRTEQYHLTGRRVEKLVRKLELKPFTTLGSASLYSIFKFSKTAASKCFRGRRMEESGSAEEEAEMHESMVSTELVDIFSEIKTKLDEEDFVSKKMCSKASPEDLYKVLCNDEVRVKLFSEECNIYAVIAEADNIRSIVVENREASSGGDHAAGAGDGEAVPSKSDFVVHSYFEPNLIIDLQLQNDRNIFVYRVMQMEDSYKYKSKVVLLYPKSKDIAFPNYFVEALQLRLRQNEYMRLVEQMPYETYVMNKEFRRVVPAVEGAAYIEFHTQTPDDFNLKLQDDSTGEVLYGIYKVITSRRARIVFPCGGCDLRITLTPKFNRNRMVRYKTMPLPGEFAGEVLVDCSIGLSKNMKFYCPVMGNTDSVIFWEKSRDEEVKGYIEDSQTKIVVTGNGAMRADNREYCLCYKNKGEKKREIKVFVGLSQRKI
jgi:hypothetical protein